MILHIKLYIISHHLRHRPIQRLTHLILHAHSDLHIDFNFRFHILYSISNEVYLLINISNNLFMLNETYDHFFLFFIRMAEGVTHLYNTNFKFLMADSFFWRCMKFYDFWNYFFLNYTIFFFNIVIIEIMA